MAKESSQISFLHRMDLDTIEKDWVPPEVRGPGARNLELPGHSFDVYSLGVLVLKLLKG